jgi:hypothetical protein
MQTPTSHGHEAVATELGEKGTDINKAIFDAPGGVKDVVDPQRGETNGRLGWFVYSAMESKGSEL